MKRILSPTNSYVQSTQLIPVPEGDDLITSIKDGTLTVRFSETMKVLKVPGDWRSWGAPPETEPGAVRRIAWTRGRPKVELRLSKPVSIIGLEASHPLAASIRITAEFFNGTKKLGTTTRPVNGSESARLFAAREDRFTRIVLSIPAGPFEAGGIAIARVRYAI